MKLRFPILLLLPPCLAATACRRRWPKTRRIWLSPPSDLPHPRHGDPTYSLDTLFGALKIAPDDDKRQGDRESHLVAWMVSGSDTCDLLMTRVKDAIEDKDYDLAIRLLNAVIAIRPGYVEAWNQRATVYYLKDDYGHAPSPTSPRYWRASRVNSVRWPASA